MDRFEKDEQPMLLGSFPQRSDDPEGSNFRRLVSRTRSASISIPMASMEPYDKEASLVGHTGPLRSVRKAPFPQTSGPLNVTQGAGNLLQQSRVFKGNMVENKAENISTFLGKRENHWNSDYDRKNENLLRSGQLGMCSDPYCTTCPAYVKVAQQAKPITSNRFDPKNSFFLKHLMCRLCYMGVSPSCPPSFILES